MQSNGIEWLASMMHARTYCILVASDLLLAVEISTYAPTVVEEWRNNKNKQRTSRSNVGGNLKLRVDLATNVNVNVKFIFIFIYPSCMHQRK